MSKPYVYLDRYKRGGFLPALTRQIPTDVGSHVRAAFHGVGVRSLEVYVQPNGFWSVETGPTPVTSGERRIIARGDLREDDSGQASEAGTRDSRAMDAIHALLNGSEWSADTAPAVAEIVHSTGRAIIDTDDVTNRLEVLRGELRAERISYGELAELQSLAAHIEPGDVELLEAAGVPEFPEEATS